MDPIRVAQSCLKFYSDSSESGVRLQSGNGTSTINSLFYKFRSVFTMIVKSSVLNSDSVAGDKTCRIGQLDRGELQSKIVLVGDEQR